MPFRTLGLSDEEQTRLQRRERVLPETETPRRPVFDGQELTPSLTQAPGEGSGRIDFMEQQARELAPRAEDAAFAQPLQRVGSPEEVTGSRQVFARAEFPQDPEPPTPEQVYAQQMQREMEFRRIELKRIAWYKKHIIQSDASDIHGQRYYNVSSPSEGVVATERFLSSMSREQRHRAVTDPTSTEGRAVRAVERVARVRSGEDTALTPEDLQALTELQERIPPHRGPFYDSQFNRRVRESRQSAQRIIGEAQRSATETIRGIQEAPDFADLTPQQFRERMNEQIAQLPQAQQATARMFALEQRPEEIRQREEAEFKAAAAAQQEEAVLEVRRKQTRLDNMPFVAAQLQEPMMDAQELAEMRQRFEAGEETPQDIENYEFGLLRHMESGGQAAEVDPRGQIRMRKGELPKGSGISRNGMEIPSAALGDIAESGPARVLRATMPEFGEVLDGDEIIVQPAQVNRFIDRVVSGMDELDDIDAVMRSVAGEMFEDTAEAFLRLRAPALWETIQERGNQELDVLLAPMKATANASLEALAAREVTARQAEGDAKGLVRDLMDGLGIDGLHKALRSDADFEAALLDFEKRNPELLDAAARQFVERESKGHVALAGEAEVNKAIQTAQRGILSALGEAVKYIAGDIIERQQAFSAKSRSVQSAIATNLPPAAGVRPMVITTEGNQTIGLIVPEDVSSEDVERAFGGFYGMLTSTNSELVRTAQDVLRTVMPTIDGYPVLTVGDIFSRDRPDGSRMSMLEQRMADEGFVTLAPVITSGVSDEGQAQLARYSMRYSDESRKVHQRTETGPVQGMARDPVRVALMDPTRSETLQTEYFAGLQVGLDFEGSFRDELRKGYRSSPSMRMSVSEASRRSRTTSDTPKDVEMIADEIGIQDKAVRFAFTQAFNDEAVQVLMAEGKSTQAVMLSVALQHQRESNAVEAAIMVGIADHQRVVTDLGPDVESGDASIQDVARYVQSVSATQRAMRTSYQEAVRNHRKRFGGSFLDMTDTEPVAVARRLQRFDEELQRVAQTVTTEDIPEVAARARESARLTVDRIDMMEQLISEIFAANPELKEPRRAPLSRIERVPVVRPGMLGPISIRGQRLRAQMSDEERAAAVERSREQAAMSPLREKRLAAIVKHYEGRGLTRRQAIDRIFDTLDERVEERVNVEYMELLGDEIISALTRREIEGEIVQDPILGRE